MDNIRIGETVMVVVHDTLIQHVCFELSCFWHIIGFEWSIHTCMCQNACHCEYPLNKVDVLSVCKQLRNVHVTVYIYDCLLVFSELDGFLMELQSW